MTEQLGTALATQPAPLEGFVMPTAHEMVTQYLQLRNHVKAETKAFAERMKPFNDGMAALEACAALLMQQTKQKALSTDAGTAFKTPSVSVTCTDRELWLDFVAEQGAWDGLTAHISKDYVLDYMEQHEGQPPPGVKVDKFWQVQFRKA